MQQKALIVAFTTILALSARADLLVLGNGETLSGTVLRVREGAVVFRTSLGGQMMAPLDTIAALSTTGNFAFGLQDGTTLYGQLETTDDGTTLKPLDGGATVSVELAQIMSGERIPETSRTGATDDASLAVELETGVRARQGTTDSVAPFARLELSRKGVRRDLSAEMMVEDSDSDDFPANAEGTTEWNFRTNKEVQPMVAVGLERDVGNALELRTDLTLGVGRVLMARRGGVIRGTAGVNLVYEDWDGRDLRKDTSKNEKQSGSEFNLRLSLRYARALFQEGEFSNTLDLYPAISDLGDIRARNLTELTVPLSQRLRLRLDLQIDYDNNPGLTGLDEWRGKVGAGIQVEF